MKLIFLDTETTGNDIAKDRLCQVCYKVDDAIHVGFFKPPLQISVKAMSITHITNKMVADKETFTGSQMKKDLEALFADDGVLVAHNAKFDAAMLEAEGLTIKYKIDTLRVARALDEESIIPEYNLQYLRYYLGLEVAGNAHDAEGDVNVLYAVFDRLFSKIKETTPDHDAAIKKMIEISDKPSLFKIFNFGKHKGAKIEDILKSDRSYLDWMLNQKLANPSEEEDWIYTLKYYLKK